MWRCNPAGYFAATIKPVLPLETIWQGRCPLATIQISGADLAYKLVSTNFLWCFIALTQSHPKELPPQTSL